jgi:DNA-binding response OmpR family regulator
MDTITTQTILLVEDEDNDVLFMRMALGKAEITNDFQVAEHGEQAIEYLSGTGIYADRRRYPLPALVLLDLKLPRIMGMDVLKWIRERREFDPMVVIVLTSSQQRSDISTASSLGANSYLVKPSNPLVLGDIMGLVKSYWLQLNQPTATFTALERSSIPSQR